MPPPPRRPPLQYAAAVALFALSLFTTTTLGGAWSLLARTDVVTDLVPILTPATVARVWSDAALLRLGLAFSLPTLFILLCHELGHWFACRHHRLDATPPYFLPAPIGLGTFGAFIRIRSLVRDKRELLDVGVAGPLAGFVALLPILAAGVYFSTPSPLPAAPASDGVLLLYRPGASLLLDGLTRLFHGALPAGVVLNPHPFLLAGWVGLFATMLNLLPLAQLDGGHILYAAVGRLQRRLAWPLWGALALLGFVWPGWWLWCLFLLLLGLRHPRLVDEAAPLDPPRRRLAWLALALFALGFMPEPIELVEIGPASTAQGRQVELERDGTVVDELHLHAGAEAAALDLAASLAQPVDQALDQRPRHLGGCGAGVRRSPATVERGEQGELRDHQQAAAGGREIEVHPAAGVVEDPQRRQPLGRSLDFARAVAGLDAHQHEQAAADGGDPLTVDLDRRSAHALQDETHRFRPSLS